MSYTAPDLGTPDLGPMATGDAGGDITLSSASGGGTGAAGYASMGLDILGGILKGMAAYQAGMCNAKVAENNALISMYAAGDSRLRGQLAAETLRLRGSQTASKQTAA